MAKPIKNPAEWSDSFTSEGDEFFDCVTGDDIPALHDNDIPALHDDGVEQEGVSGSEDDTFVEETEAKNEDMTDTDEIKLEKNKTDEEEDKEQKARLDKERLDKESELTEEERNQMKERAEELRSQANNMFGTGFYTEAADIYTEALAMCPMIYSDDRSKLFSNRAACYVMLNDFVTAAKDCTEAIEIGAFNEKPLERRAKCYARSEDTYDSALKDYAELMKQFPDKEFYKKQHAAVVQLIEERNAKLKEDMVAKLKNLGDMCLRPFGLSTDSFEMVPQEGGGYSINMKKPDH